MKFTKLLRMERTAAGVYGSQTFNAPGNFATPFGKTTVNITGRGASGNAATYPYANTNAASYPYAYTNPTNYPYAGTNPTNYPYAGTNATSYPYQYSNAPSYPYAYSNAYVVHWGANAPNGYGGNPAEGWGNALPGPYSFYWYNGKNDGTGYVTYYAIEGFPGNAVYNTDPGTAVYSTVPGNAYYNTEPGNAYYNTSPGNAEYNYVAGTANYTTVPGNVGAPAVIAGAYFAGGAVGALAGVLPATATTLEYSASGFSITVPVGGYITLQNVA